LHAVVTIVMIILYVQWWSWAHLCCIWKLPNPSQRQKYEKSRFYAVLATIWIKKSRSTKEFYKE